VFVNQLVPVLSPQDAVSELKERARGQYQRMHALLEANQAETMQMLESTYTMYVRKNTQQVLQLNEKRQEAEKLLSSVLTFFKRADGINFMKVQLHSCPSATQAQIGFAVFTSTESNDAFSRTQKQGHWPKDCS